MDEIDRLIPADKPKPSIWGERYRAWEELDRATLMALLARVRERYVAGVHAEYAAHHPAHTPDEVRVQDAQLAVLEHLRAETLRMLALVPDAEFRTVPDGETWSCHDLVNHLAVDEDGEFHPGPPDTLLHRICTDAVHVRQLRRFLHKLGITESGTPPAEQGTAT